MFVDMALYEGRPPIPQSEKEEAVYDLLDALGIHYFRADHDPAATIEACAAVESVLGAAVCKNLFLANRQQTVFYLLMMPGDKPFRTKDLSAELGCSRLSFGTPGAMEQLLGTSPGSASAFGLANDKTRLVRPLVDKSLLENKWICCHPCVNTSTLKLLQTDLFERFLPHIKHEITYVTL